MSDFDSASGFFDIMASSSSEAQKYLEVLNGQQLEAVTHSGSPLLILAGAGSGKTRVITTKIAWLIEQGIDPHQILAVTFTKKAANEMKERAKALDARSQYSQIRTFHSFGAWFLRLNALEAGIDPNFTVYDDDDCVTLIQKACEKLTKQQANHFAHEISLAKDYCYTPDSEKLDEIDSDPEFRSVYAAYEKRLRETGNVDFGDLIMLPYLVLKNNEYLRMRMYSRFKVIMVDEYQDSNVAQFLLLQELSGVKYGMCASKENPDGTYICVVGDDDQSIYKFRGAEIQNILTYKDKFPGTKIIRLESNYRSTEEILSIADDVVQNNEGRLGKTLKAERGKGKKPVLAFLPNQDEEANFCADLIKLAHEKTGTPYSDWAILYRTNAQSLTFESTFLHRKIPYQVVGSLKFYEREEVKDMLSYLSLLANPRDEVAFRRIVNKPARGIGATTQEKLITLARESLLRGEVSPSLQNQTAPQMAETDSRHLLRSAGSSATLSAGDTPATPPSVTACDYNLIEECRKNVPSLSKKAKEGLSNFIEAFDEFKNKLGVGNTAQPLSVPVEPVENIAANEALNAAMESRKATDRASEKEILPGEIPAKLSELIELISEKSGLKEYHASQDEVSGTQKVANLQELANSAVLYPCSMEGLLEFLDHIELDRTLENPDEEIDDNRVTLITLHNTKGLEFSRVIMTGMELGIFPRQDKTGDDLEEERRLCYVGITRAKNELYMTNCATRRVYGRTDFMAVSPFLLEISPEKLKTIGHAPASFRRSSFRGGDYGERGLSHPDTESDPVKRKYCRGAKIYHDDYGYGIISFTEENDEGEYCITVSFENSGKKKFIPKYQSSSLMVIKD